jgi:large subunit ribosomal protein L27
MAHKKGVGSSKNGRESESKRLGVKILEDKLLLQEHHHKTKRFKIQVQMFTSVKITPTRKSRWCCAFPKKRDNKSYVSIIPFEVEA